MPERGLVQPAQQGPACYHLDRGVAVRVISGRDGRRHESTVLFPPDADGGDPEASFDLGWPRAAEVPPPAHVVVENVPAALHDRRGIVHAVRAALEALGYQVSMGILNAAAVGVAQRRRRLFLVASSLHALDVDAIAMTYRTPE